MAKTKSKNNISKKKSFKNPALIAIIVAVVAVGTFFAFQTFAAGTGATPTGKDAYGCPKDFSQRPTLSLGNSGACVKTAQNDLNTYHLAGIAPLAVDGQYGPNTKNAVIAYQKYVNTAIGAGEVGKLVVDGVLGQKTWSYLCAAERPGVGK